jgi:hypothetical protein
LSNNIEPEAFSPNGYPAIRFLVRHGNRLALAVGLAIFIAGVAAAASGWGWGFALAGIVGAPLGYLFVRCYAEMAQVIAETLLPR